MSAWVVNREFHTLRWVDVARSMADVELEHVLLASVVALFTYGVLSLYDTLALLHLGKRIRYPRILLTAFIASAFSHNMGVSFLSGGSVRYRMYSSWGFSALDVVRVIAFCALTFWVGFFATAGTMCFVISDGRSLPVSLSPTALQAAGAVCIGLVLVYLAFSERVRPLKVGRLVIVPPAWPIAFGQILVSSLEWLLMTSILYLLLPPGSVSFSTLLGLFLFAHMAGLVSQVPAGLGVFEYVLLNALAPVLPADTLLGRVVLYRVIYYFGPLVLAVLLLGGSEILRRRLQIQRLLRRATGRPSALRASEPGSE